MPLFKYEAVNFDGKIVNGFREAGIISDVESWMTKNSLSPIDIRIAGVGDSSGTDEFDASSQITLRHKFKGISLEDRILLCRQLSTMLDAGVAILQALDIIIKQTVNPFLKNIIKQVAAHIEAGGSLSEAFAKFPKEFSVLFQNIIKVGEESGGLDISFDYLGKVFENEKDVKEKIKAATRYPKIVIVGIIGAVVFLMVFVMPKFVTMFAGSKVALPLPTRILITTSNLMTEYIILMVTVAVIAFVGYQQALKVKDFVRFRDGLILKIPVMGMLTIKILMSRFCRVFAVMSKSGIDIIRNLQLAASALDNLVLQETIHRVMSDVEKGVDLYDSMSKHQLFPPMVVQMVSIGEKSGTLDTMMDKVADYYEVETDYTIKELSALIEPVLLVVMGSIVGLMALAIYMPMWNMMNVMR